MSEPSHQTIPGTFAVVIPVYNGRAHIVQTVESALQQSHRAHEIIVIEDGSPAPAGDLLTQFPSVVYRLQANTGVSGARNHGAHISRSEWICFLDQDDTLLPEHLEQFAKHLQTVPDADLVYTPRFVVVEREGVWIRESVTAPPAPGELAHVLLNRCPFPPSGICVRRSAFERLGGFLSRYDLAEDWEFWLRSMKHGLRFERCDLPTVCYRVHPESNSHRPLPILHANTRVIRECVQPLLPWPASFWKTHQLLSRQEADAAILLRQTGKAGGLPQLLRSLLRWPFADVRRYRIAAHMVLSAIAPGSRLFGARRLMA